MDPQPHSIEDISYSLTAHWQVAGTVDLAGIDYQLVMPEGLPQVAGVYRIEATETREVYVGEGASLSRRLRNFGECGLDPRYLQPHEPPGPELDLSGPEFRKVFVSSSRLHLR